MAQTVTPQYNQGYFDGQLQSGTKITFVVVDQQPRQRESFPYKLQIEWIFGFSIPKCIIGALLVITGIVNVLKVDYDSTQVGASIWCGVIIIASGVIGCTLKCKQTKCLIGAFLGLSITALILDVAMLSYYGVILEYFVNIVTIRCIYYKYYNYGHRRICVPNITSDAKDLGIGMTAGLMIAAFIELVCSIGSVVQSCKAYSKCCNTCNTNDCCTCLGCCECDSEPLGTQNVVY